MLWQLAARVLTGPLAFLLGGVIELAGYAIEFARAKRTRASDR